MMQFIENGFNISMLDIIIFVFTLTALFIIYKMFNIAGWKNREYNKNNDSFDENWRRNNMIFEEKISGVTFRYDEEERILQIIDSRGNMSRDPINIELDGIGELIDFVDRLEEYVDEQ